MAGPNGGTDQFTIPQRPIRRRLNDVPAFVVHRGGEYCAAFSPGGSRGHRPAARCADGAAGASGP